MVSSSMFTRKTMSVFVFCICTLMLGFGLWVGWLGQRRRPEALKKSRKNWSSALLCSFAASLAHPRHTCVHMPVFIRAFCELLLNCTWYAKHGYSNWVHISFSSTFDRYDHQSNLTDAQFAMALGSKRAQKANFAFFIMWQSWFFHNPCVLSYSVNFFAVYFIVGFALFEVINHRWVGLDARPTKPAALTPAHLATTLVLRLTIKYPRGY